MTNFTAANICASQTMKICAANSFKADNQGNVSSLNGNFTNVNATNVTTTNVSTSNLTATGSATFSNPPVCAVSPTSNNQLANKSYVDAGFVSGQSINNNTIASGTSVLCGTNLSLTVPSSWNTYEIEVTFSIYNYDIPFACSTMISLYSNKTNSFQTGQAIPSSSTQLLATPSGYGSGDGQAGVSYLGQNFQTSFAPGSTIYLALGFGNMPPTTGTYNASAFNIIARAYRTS